MMWKRMDMVEGLPHHIMPLDECYYARDYVSHGGFSASVANQLIMNFKKPASTKGTPQWHYKGKAARQFASEFADLFEEFATFPVAVVPPSKCRNDPDYDPRFDMFFDELARIAPNLIQVEPISQAKSVPAAHHQAARPSIDDVYGNLVWDGDAALQQGCSEIVLVDDVVTAGTHFKACQRIITENLPGTKVSGVFWGRTVWS